jgi:hypothetical protein
MAEVPPAGEDHGRAVLVERRADVVVALPAAGLDDGSHAGRGNLHPTESLRLS